MHFPTWVDLKGEDAVPETVHHCVVMVDPQKDKSWEASRRFDFIILTIFESKIDF